MAKQQRKQKGEAKFNNPRIQAAFERPKPLKKWKNVQTINEYNARRDEIVPYLLPPIMVFYVLSWVIIMLPVLNGVSLLISAIFNMLFLLMLININLPKVDFSVRPLKVWSVFIIILFFIFVTYFSIGMVLWSFLLNDITGKNAIIADLASTRDIPTIGVGIIFFYKLFGYLQNINLGFSKTFEIFFKEALPFIPLRKIEVMNTITDVLRDFILVSGFFLLLSAKAPVEIWASALSTVFIMSLIFTGAEVFVWLVTTQYWENILKIYKPAVEQAQQFRMITMAKRKQEEVLTVNRRRKMGQYRLGWKPLGRRKATSSRRKTRP